MSSSLVNSLAKVYDRNPLHGQKPGGRKLSLNGSEKSQAFSSSSPSSSPHDATLHNVESRIDSLSSQMERLLNMQQTVLTRLDGLSQDVRGMGQDLASMRDEGYAGRRGSGLEVCRELFGAVERTSERMESHGRRLEGVEKLVEGTHQVISFIGEVVKNSRLVELLFKESGNKANKKVRGLTTLQTRLSCKKWLTTSSNSNVFSSLLSPLFCSHRASESAVHSSHSGSITGCCVINGNIVRGLIAL